MLQVILFQRDCEHNPYQCGSASIASSTSSLTSFFSQHYGVDDLEGTVFIRAKNTL
jgi:hypothetical protein